jgi:hypothetical protein
VGRRGRRRSKSAGPSTADAPGTTDHPYGEGNVLSLRDSLSPGTLRRLEALESTPAASAEDRWQRRVEFLFERLVVRWVIAGLPLEGQKELLGRYRMADSEERRQVAGVLTGHVRARHPELEL